MRFRRTTPRAASSKGDSHDPSTPTVGNDEVPKTSEDPVQVPEDVREAAHAAFDMCERSVPVADLVADTQSEPTSRQGQVASRQLRFVVADVGVIVSAVRVGPAKVALTIQVQPAGLVTLDVRQEGSSFITTTDTGGQADFEVRPGLISLVVRPHADEPGRAFQTSWVHV